MLKVDVAKGHPFLLNADDTTEKETRNFQLCYLIMAVLFSQRPIWLIDISISVSLLVITHR
jgi:hypothetical protein